MCFILIVATVKNAVVSQFWSLTLEQKSLAWPEVYNRANWHGLTGLKPLSLQMSLSFR